MFSLAEWMHFDSSSLLARLCGLWQTLPGPLHTVRNRLLTAPRVEATGDFLIFTLRMGATTPPGVTTDPKLARRYLLDVCGFSEANIAGNADWLLLSRASNEAQLLRQRHPAYFCWLPQPPDPALVDKHLAKRRLKHVPVLRDFLLTFDGLRDGDDAFVSFVEWQNAARALKDFKVKIPGAWKNAVAFFRARNGDAICLDPTSGKVGLLTHDEDADEPLREWPSFERFITGYPGTK